MSRPPAPEPLADPDLARLDRRAIAIGLGLGLPLVAFLLWQLLHHPLPTFFTSFPL